MQHAAAARSAAATTVPTAEAAVVAALEAIAAAVVVFPEVEEVFEEAVAGADGIMGRFRSGGGSPARGSRVLDMGRCHAPSLTSRDAARAF